MMRNLGFSTLVADMEGYRSKGYPVDWLLDMTARAGDLTPETASRTEKVYFLAEGSPTLRYIIHRFRDWVLQSGSSAPPRKLLITEDTPLEAWLWELVCNYLYVQTEVLHF